MKKIAFVLLSALFSASHAGEIAVIGNANVPKMDLDTVAKIYAGKVVTVEGVEVSPVNTGPGVPPRSEFLKTVLSQSEEKYVAYWTVRKFIGKGVPPKEVASAAEVASYVETRPGAIGYVNEADVRQGQKVVARATR